MNKKERKYYAKPVIEIIDIGGSSILRASEVIEEKTDPTPEYSGELGAPRCNNFSTDDLD